MSINVDSILNKISSNLTRQRNAGSTSKNYTVSDNIFAQAEALVNKYNEEKENAKNSTSSNSNGFLSNFSVSELANMSTSDFLNYAYENKANSGYKDSSTDSSGVKLPMLVRYKAEVISTSGKSFMQVVAKFKAKYPNRSETEIAAELMAKYGDSDTNETNNQLSSSGNTLNISA